MTSLLGHDHSSTLLAFKRDSILPVYEKLTYYFLDRLRWRWDIRSTNTQLVVMVWTQVQRLIGPVSNQLEHPNVGTNNISTLVSMHHNNNNTDLKINNNKNFQEKKIVHCTSLPLVFLRNSDPNVPHFIVGVCNQLAKPDPTQHNPPGWVGF